VGEGKTRKASKHGQMSGTGIVPKTRNVVKTNLVTGTRSKRQDEMDSGNYRLKTILSSISSNEWRRACNPSVEGLAR
jgi:hypothetical protein